MKKTFGILALGAFLLFSASCNRGSGCPATEAMQKTASMSPGEMMGSQKKSKKTNASKSSVMPAEVKYKSSKKKKSKKGCK